MSYRLIWATSAQDDLLQIIFARPDRIAIVSALNRLGATLQREGPTAGESRESNYRVLVELPLGVKFSVDELDRSVKITDVWSIGS